MSEKHATPPRWNVFPNTDCDVGGWYSYVENGEEYLGGDLHRTKAAAEAHARQVAKAASAPLLPSRKPD